MARPFLVEDCDRSLDLRQLVQARLLVPNTRFAWCWVDREGRSLGEMGVSVKIDHLVLGWHFIHTISFIPFPFATPPAPPSQTFSGPFLPCSTL